MPQWVPLNGHDAFDATIPMGTTNAVVVAMLLSLRVQVSGNHNRVHASLKSSRGLQQRDKKLQDVARSVGYESDAAFSKAFKRVVGANPSEYLKLVFEDRGNARMAEAF
jgi:hypothetical protein